MVASSFQKAPGGSGMGNNQQVCTSAPCPGKGAGAQHARMEQGPASRAGLGLNCA